jgi:myo-inositol-1(or 4)-monophosphatase
MPLPIPSSADLLKAACAAAQAAGQHAWKNRGRRSEVVASFAHDVKLRLDLESQEVAESVLRQFFPHHRIRGEESTGPADGADDATCEWIIDPIDGTVNFSHGLPLWCCSIAVRAGGRMRAGVVYAPALDECYTATDDGPAECNGRRLAVSSVSSLSAALVMTGLDKGIDPRLPPFEIFRTLSASVQKARIMGVAALDLCRVAAGQADAYFENGIYIWDIAAAGLIVERAGGRSETLADLGGGRLRHIASNGHIHEALRDLIESVIKCPSLEKGLR